MAKLLRACCGRGETTDYVGLDSLDKAVLREDHLEAQPPSAGKQLRLLLIVHKKRAKDTTLISSVNRLVRDGYDLQVFVSQDEQEVTNIINKDRRERTDLGRPPTDVYVAVGGSGTINEVVTGLINNNMPSSTRLAVVPMGDNADFSSSQLGIPRNPLRALRLAATGQAHPIDVGIVNKTQVFMNMCVAGLGCEGGLHCPMPSPATLQMPSPATLRPCLCCAPKNGLDSRTSSARSQLGRSSEREGEGIQEYDGNLLLLAIGNGQKTGEGMRLCPDASLGDGLLDITYVLDADDDKVCLLQKSMAQKVLDRHLRSDVHCLRVPWLELHSPAPLQVDCDGEVLEGRDFRFEVLHRRLQMVLPESA